MDTYEDVMVAITVFSLFMAMPLLLLVGMPVKPPRWYRVLRATYRAYVRALRSTPL